MIIFEVDNEIFLELDSIQFLPRSGEQLNFEQSKDSIYRVVDIEHKFSSSGVQKVIVKLVEYKN